MSIDLFLMKNKNKIHNKKIKRKKQQHFALVQSHTFVQFPNLATIPRQITTVSDKHLNPVDLISHGHLMRVRPFLDWNHETFWFLVVHRIGRYISTFRYTSHLCHWITYWPDVKQTPLLIKLNLILERKALSVRLNQVSGCWFNLGLASDTASNMQHMFVLVLWVHRKWFWLFRHIQVFILALFTGL